MKPFKDDTEKELYEVFAQMLRDVYPDILKSAIADERSDYKDGVNRGLVVAFDLFQAVTEQGRQLQALQAENKRLVERFFKGDKMSKLNFTPSKLCFSADDEVMIKAFKKHLHTYKVQSLDGVAGPLLDCAFGLFHIVQTQRESIKALEIKAGIREENDR